MPEDAATAQELDAYREQTDRFLADLDEEYYLHYAGLKKTYELAPIYDRHSELTKPERARSLELAADGSAGIRELWRFACEGYLGNLTREQAERIAELQAALTATVDGREIGYRMLRSASANEPDRSRRERLDAARTALTEEHLNPLHLGAAQATHRATADLGAPNYVELYRRLGFGLDDLAGQCTALLDSTERIYEEAADRLFRARVGVGLDEAERWDVARLFRAPAWDPAFPKDMMLPALEGTLADLGIDLRAQSNVHLDIEERPQKSPRAFCAPIEVPGRVMLVIQPIGGVDDWRALFHEAGHTEHFAHTSADLAVEDKRLGDNAVTEGWAALFQHLTDEPAWLNRRLDMPRVDDFAIEAATGFLLGVRRYCAKLLYEIEFHAAPDVTAMRPRYVELLGDALKIEPSGVDYLADIDDGFYASSYLRSWAFEAQMRSFLREEFGNTWFARREAGSLLRELWSEGQRLNADELLREVAGTPVEMEAVADRIREILR
ncbi:MAG: hypothetical protein H0U03_04755 [Actinobacteria bacterium]|nr:hypothetical protein [Actinomycetota bacterium]